MLNLKIFVFVSALRALAHLYLPFLYLVIQNRMLLHITEEKVLLLRPWGAFGGAFGFCPAGVRHTGCVCLALRC